MKFKANIIVRYTYIICHKGKRSNSSYCIIVKSYCYLSNAVYVIQW